MHDGSRFGRRKALKAIGGGAGSLSLLSASSSASAFHTYDEDDFGDDVEDLMGEFDVHGVSVAIEPSDDQSGGTWAEAYGDDYVYEGTGWTYTSDLTTDVRLRLASVVKLLTSSAIVDLIDAGHLDADDQVFGYDGLLSPSRYGDPEATCRLTISDLLNHQYDVASNESRPVYAVDREVDDLRELIVAVHDEYDVVGGCNTVSDYRNYGYGVLGAVIEETMSASFAGGSTYEWFVRDAVLEPAGAEGMDTVAQHQGEVDDEGWHHSDDGDPYDAPIRDLAWPWAAWAGTPTEVASFGQHVLDDWVGSKADVDDYEDLVDYGWWDYEEDGRTYVGHNGGQIGVLASLRCRPSSSVCVMINTRHRNTWADSTGPRDELVENACRLAEEQF